MNLPSSTNHFILFSDGSVIDILSELTGSESLDTIITKLRDQHGDLLKAVDSPLKIFELVTGLRRDNSQFVQIGEVNWKNLWLIRKDFYYYLAFIYKNNERVLVASSECGVFWNFNVVSA